MLAATTESRLKLHASSVTVMHMLVTGSLGLVYDQAKRCRNGGGAQQFEELVEEGKVALCEGVQVYLQKRPGCRMSTFLVPRIRAAMITYLRTEHGETEWQGRLVAQVKAEDDRISQLMVKRNGRSEPLGAMTDAEARDVYGDRWAEVRHESVSFVSYDEATAEIDQRRSAPHTDPATVLERKWDRLPNSSRDLIRCLSTGATVGQVSLVSGVSRETILSELRSAKQTLCDDG